MSALAPLPRHSLYLRLLRASLVAGAIYDSLLAGSLLVVPDLSARLLQVAAPSGDVFLRLLAVLLLSRGAFTLLAAYDVVAYGGNVVVAIGARGAAGVALCAAASGRTELAGLYLPGAAELFLAAAYAASWWPIRRPGKLR